MINSFRMALAGNNVDEMFTALATTIKRKRIDELENGGNGASFAEQSVTGTVKLGSGGDGARI
jgi:hypothetical protein